MKQSEFNQKFYDILCSGYAWMDDEKEEKMVDLCQEARDAGCDLNAAFSNYYNEMGMADLYEDELLCVNAVAGIDLKFKSG